jgi:hypothetical protein
MSSRAILLIMGFLCMACLSCRKSDTEGPGFQGDDTYDVDARGIPRFANADYIDLDKIHRISRFRSSVGHDYWDDFERCRSLKHYFEPKDTVDWSTVEISSPVTGTIFRKYDEWAGTQVHIKSDSFPAFYFIIFHINLSNPLNVGDKVQTRQKLGTHIGSQTMSDIAVGVSTPSGWRLVSYFDVMTDSVFAGYHARGVASRSDAVISREARDADTLRCNGDMFLNTGTLENWIILN